ncbi:MAG: 3H domain-containing protein [Faecalibacterium prausnitzii]
MLGVSRQIVVGDVALLRAGGCADRCNAPGLSAAPGGEGLYRHSGLRAQHRRTRCAPELYTVVDQGGIVVDVAVENSLYGELRGNLNLCQPVRCGRNFIQQADGHAGSAEPHDRRRASAHPAPARMPELCAASKKQLDRQRHPVPQGVMRMGIDPV